MTIAAVMVTAAPSMAATDHRDSGHSELAPVVLTSMRLASAVTDWG
jgi:hypothetical protein